MESLAWHELPPSLEPIPELTTLELVAVKEDRSSGRRGSERATVQIDSTTRFKVGVEANSR